MTGSKLRNYFLLHFIVFIWGWTAVLGKLITLPAVKLVWLRLPIAISGILIYMLWKKVSLRIDLKNFFIYSGVGLIVAIHWIFFYGAVKLSNVSVTLACFSTISIFTAILEPILYKRKVRMYELFFGLMVISALMLIFFVGKKDEPVFLRSIQTFFNAGKNYELGMLFGVLAAFTSSLFSTLNGMLINQKNAHHEAASMSLWELTGGFLGMTIYVLLANPYTGELIGMSTENFIWMLTLGLVCTSLPFLISMNILKTLSPYTIALTLNLETVYGILFAWFIFQEDKQMSLWFYIGAALILSTLALNAWFKAREERKQTELPAI
ncbi:MAG: DMT family transporter [Bacteroidia bacterium]